MSASPVNTEPSFVAVSPARLADTRPGFATVDGQFAGAGRVGPGEVYSVKVTGRGGVPASGVGAVAVNVTVTQPTQASYLTVFPSGEVAPNASNLNFVAGQTIPNMVIAKVGADGSISIRNDTGAAFVIVDIAGWYADGGSFTSVSRD